MSVAIGDMAPDFTLPGTNDAKITLSHILGKQHVVIVFNTADSTGG